MTTTAPVGWPAPRPGVPSHGPSPEPVGWQGIAVTAIEVASDEAPGVVAASVSRETEAESSNDVTPLVGAPLEGAVLDGAAAIKDAASVEDAAVEDEDEASRPDGEARLDPQQSEVTEVRGYDILLGGAIVPRETSDTSNGEAKDEDADGGRVETAVSDGPGPGDAATTITMDPATMDPASEGETYVPRHHADDADEAEAEPMEAQVEPVNAKVVPDEALAANALPSRRARRAARPRVPAFDRVTETDWQHPVEDAPSAYSASPVQTPETARTLAEAENGEMESSGLQHSGAKIDEFEQQDEFEQHGIERDATATGDADGPSAENVDVPRPARVSYTSVEQLPRPAHPRVLTVANQKGGVGKTTTTVNVAAGLAQAGLKVLVIDIDPQGNASTALGIEHHADVPSVYDVIVEGTPIVDVMAECPEIPGLWCAPATIDLAGAEIELVSLVARESRLHRAINAALAAASEEDRFDYVFIDCPPSLGLLTVNAFVAADEVFIPIQCEYYALEGLSQLLKNIEMIKMHLNPGLHVSTILLTMYDGRTNLSAQVADEVRTHFPEQVLGALVPRSVRISEAPSHGETVMTYDPSSTGAMSYRDAAREIALRGGAVPEPSGRIGR